LPEVRDRRLAMLHAVPTALSKNKDLASLYSRHWNRCVSPGEAVYAFQGPGQELLHQARQQGLTPKGEIHDKEIFL